MSGPGSHVLKMKSLIKEAISKNGFWFPAKSAGSATSKAAANIKPEEYIGYFEDLI
jgi:hypothetical protein